MTTMAYLSKNISTSRADWFTAPCKTMCKGNNTRNVETKNVLLNPLLLIDTLNRPLIRNLSYSLSLSLSLWLCLRLSINIRNAIASVIFARQESEWSFSSGRMELDSGSFCCNRKQPLELSAPTEKEKHPTEKNLSSSGFVNHAAITWHESRRKWVGDQSRRSKRKAKDPIISWSMAYEDLLLTSDPFSEPIPLPEMVDFLVDIWHDEGLFD